MGYSYSVALIMAAIIVAAAFTSVPVRATVINGSTAIPGTILGMSGTVEIRTSGNNEWRPLVHSDTIEPGDMVMTGSDGLLLIKFSSAGKILLGEETNVTYSDSTLLLQASLRVKLCLWVFKLSLGVTTTTLSS